MTTLTVHLLLALEFLLLDAVIVTSLILYWRVRPPSSVLTRGFGFGCAGLFVAGVALYIAGALADPSGTRPADRLQVVPVIVLAILLLAIFGFHLFLLHQARRERPER